METVEDDKVGAAMECDNGYSVLRVAAESVVVFWHGIRHTDFT
jgi:hypothetical protein